MIKTPSFLNKRILVYLAKFIGAFCILYFGTLAVEGLAAPEGKYYSGFIKNYFNYVSWLRSSLTYATKWLLEIFGYSIDIISDTYFRVRNAKGVHMGYDCLGYGVFSFWLAFVFANTGSWKNKLKWMLGGVLLLWFINVLRISLLLVATNKGWVFPFGWDHHTWFNIAAYGAIFSMIWMYDRGNKQINKEKMNKG